MVASRLQSIARRRGGNSDITRTPLSPGKSEEEFWRRSAKRSSRDSEISAGCLRQYENQEGGYSVSSGIEFGSRELPPP